MHGSGTGSFLGRTRLIRQSNALAEKCACPEPRRGACPPEFNALGPDRTGRPPSGPSNRGRFSILTNRQRGINRLSTPAEKSWRSRASLPGEKHPSGPKFFCGLIQPPNWRSRVGTGSFFGRHSLKTEKTWEPKNVPVPSRVDGPVPLHRQLWLAPVLDCQARNPGEVIGIPGDENPAMFEGGCRDNEVRIPARMFAFGASTHRSDVRSSTSLVIGYTSAF